MSATLTEAVRKLAIARSAEQAVKSALQVKRDAFAAANAALLATEKEAKAAVAQAEADVHALALAAYDADKSNKKPATGVEIKLFKVVTYDSAKAFEFAKDRKMFLVPEHLDTAEFEKAVKATPGQFPFVKITEEPKPTIAKDLDKALAIVDVTTPAAEPEQKVEPAPAPKRRGRTTRRQVEVIETTPPQPATTSSHDPLPWED